MPTRRELTEAAARYRADGRQEKKEILDEFVIRAEGAHGAGAEGRA